MQFPSLTFIIHNKSSLLFLAKNNKMPTLLETFEEGIYLRLNGLIHVIMSKGCRKYCFQHYRIRKIAVDRPMIPQSSHFLKPDSATLPKCGTSFDPVFTSERHLYQTEYEDITQMIDRRLRWARGALSLCR